MEDDPLSGHPVLRTVRILGRSATNIVVLASNATTGQLLAVKLIPRGFDSRQAKYLLRELLNHYELTLAKHPHIVSLLDCFLTPRHIAIVLEYVDGENLQVFMEKAGGCIIESLARFLFQQLVIALDFCHRRGKVNRNIRPSGLLLQLSDSALPLLKMADFSQSKDTLRNSEPRSQVGTAMFCAPEVLTNFSGASYDAAAADMWAVGVVLFMMLFGRHPFARPEDMELPAQQQVIAMFKRVTAPAGSYDGDLLIPHVLPTCVLAGALPGEPLSLAGADLLRGLLSRDPKTRMTLASVQMHEWFRTGLPEGAALLNEVVAAEEAAAGAAAIMPPAVAVQLEKMVVQAAAGPAAGAPPSVKDVGRSESGDAGGAGGAPPPPRANGRSSGGGMPYAPSTPQSSGPPPTQGPQGFAHTATACGSSDAAQQSVSIGSTVAGTARPEAGGQVSTATATLTTPAPALTDPAPAHGSPVGSATGRHVSSCGGAASVAGDGCGGGGGGGGEGDLLADLEAMVMGLPDDDILNAASLDFLMGASTLQHNQQSSQHARHDHLVGGPSPSQPQLVDSFPPLPLDCQNLTCQQHQQDQHQQQQQQGLIDANSGGGGSAGPGQYHHQRQPSGSTFGGPVSTDTTTVPSPPHTSPPPSGFYHQAGQQPNGRCGAHPAYDTHPHPTSADAGSQPRPSDAGAPGVPGTHAETLGKPALPGMNDAPHRPAGPSPPPQLYMSLQTAAAATNGSGGAGEVAASLLMRLNTDSLPSPTTLAVVDAQPFLARDLSGNWGRKDNSMATIPSTYSMDWCTLSARSQTLLSPRYTNGLQGGSGGSGGAGMAGGGAGGGNGSTSLMHNSLWHRICNEARGTLSGMASDARATVAGLGARR